MKVGLAVKKDGVDGRDIGDGLIKKYLMMHTTFPQIVSNQKASFFVLYKLR